MLASKLHESSFKHKGVITYILGVIFEAISHFKDGFNGVHRKPIPGFVIWKVRTLEKMMPESKGAFVDH